VGDGKGKEALAGFWKRVRRNKVKIEIVTSDLSAAFIASVMENAPDAVHVYDKFHVTQLVSDAVDKVRRNVYAQETDLEKRKIIKGSRWLLLTKDKDVMDDEKKKRLDNILRTNTPLFHAYYLKEDLDQIWMQQTREEGERQLLYWYERAREIKLRPFIKAANTLMARRTGILAWYDASVTNAMLEGSNNKIKVMKRKAYGYRDEKYFKLLLFGLHDKTNTIWG
jgi:transposase